MTIERPVAWPIVVFCACFSAGIAYLALFEENDWAPRVVLALVAAIAAFLALAAATSLTITVDARLRAEWRSLLPGAARYDVDVDARAIRSIVVTLVRPESDGPEAYEVEAVLERGGSIRVATFDEVHAEYVAELLRHELGCAPVDERASGAS